MRWSVFFSTSVANETENLNIWSKLNQWATTHIMKVSTAGTCLKESEKKVYESLYKKNNSQDAEEAKIVSSEHIVSVTGHRSQRYKFP